MFNITANRFLPKLLGNRNILLLVTCKVPITCRSYLQATNSKRCLEPKFHQLFGKGCGFVLEELKEKNIPLLRRKMGIVFQDFQLLTDRNVFDNLLFVLKATGWKDKKKMSDKINEVIEKVGMADSGPKLPYQLSGGEQQRIAIARALLNDPELILADEPTGNLDPSTSEEIMLLMQDISKNGRAILMATHDYSLILKFPHETLKCENGQIFSTVQNTL